VTQNNLHECAITFLKYKWEKVLLYFRRNISLHSRYKEVQILMLDGLSAQPRMPKANKLSTNLKKP